MGSGEFHWFIDGRCAAVECSAEDVGEAEHVVDLVGVVGASGGENQVGARCHCRAVVDFRVGVSEGENYRPVGH